MRLMKCPRCELNYLREGETYCSVCRREMRGEDRRDENEMCSICNEHPVMPGKELCVYCYAEMQRGNSSVNNDAGDISVEVDIDPVSEMDAIETDADTGMSESEFQEMENELSLDEMSEDEAEKDEESDRDEDE